MGKITHIGTPSDDKYSSLAAFKMVYYEVGLEAKNRMRCGKVFILVYSQSIAIPVY